MSNPEAVKQANTQAARTIIEVVRGVYDANTELHEKMGVRDDPTVYMPRIVAEAIEFLAARIDKLESHVEELEDALEECERGHSS